VHKIFSKTLESSINVLNENYQNKKYLEFIRDYESVNKILSACKIDSLNQIFENANFAEKYILSQNNILSLYTDNILPQKNSNSEKISKMIDGTVTIWLDLGVKLEAGKAFSNKAIGSGFFIDSRGYLITNYHVISSQVDPEYEGISRLYIKFSNDTETRIPAKVVGYDESLDLALLKTEVPPQYVFSLGSSSSLDIGDKIYAIGSPVGLERTLTSGIVSAEGRQLFSIGTVMQIDAAVNNGNSGGPIIDENGNVQAIVFAGMLQYQGLNFAIPVEYLKLLLPRFYYGGEILHSFVGIYGKTEKNKGVKVLWTQNSSPAKYAGIKEGDIITCVNGTEIFSIEQLHFAQISLLPNSIVEYKILDENNCEKTVLVYSTVRSKNPGLDFYKKTSISDAIYPLFGMKLENVSSGFGNKYIIESVVKGSIADETGFTALDPVKIYKTYLSPEKDILFAEIYSKKKSNGYLDVSLVLATPLDSENYF
jgi:S1-C subfamily serine protease